MIDEELIIEFSCRLLIAPALTLPIAVLLWAADVLHFGSAGSLAVAPTLILAGGIVVWATTMRLFAPLQ